MAVQYYATVKIVIPQMVHCRNCDCKFIYEQTVTGRGSSPQYFPEEKAKTDAEKAAQANLAYQLNNREDLYTPIPCPQCYHYQPYMQKRAGQEQYLSLGCLAGSLLLLGFLAAVWGGIAWYSNQQPKSHAMVIGCIGVGALLVGGILWSWARRLVARYDPNSIAEVARIKLATERAMSLDAYDLKQLDRVQTKYKEHTAACSVKPWQNTSTKDQSAPLVIEWWAEPSVFLNGGTIVLRLSDTNVVTLVIPEDAEPGSDFEVTQPAELITPVKVRVHAINTHPEEQRLD